MANVGKLNILVGASIGGLQKGLSGAAKTVQGFSSSITRGIGNVGRLLTSQFAAVAGVVGAGSVTVGLVKASQSIDSLSKSAQSLGVGTEQLGALRYAASLAGVEAESLDTGLGRMLRTIGEAGGGNKAAIKMLGDIGLSVQDLQGLNAQQQFGLIADKIRGIVDPAQRAAAAMDIFGRGGLKLMPLMLSGSEGIKAAADEAQRLGILVKDLDAKQVEAMNDAFSKVQFAVSGVFQKIVVELAPSLETAFTAGAFTAANLGDSIATTFANIVNEVLFFANTWDQQWKLLGLKAELALEDIKTKIISFFKGPIWAGLDMIGLGGAQDTSISETQKQMDVLMRDITAQREEWEKIRAARKNPLKDEAAFFTDGFKQPLKDEADFFDNLGDAGLDATLALGRSIREITEPLRDESAFFTDLGTETNVPSTELAAATQVGTTEAASQIFGAMAAIRGEDNAIEDNTGETATNTGRIADAFENFQPVNLSVIDAF